MIYDVLELIDVVRTINVLQNMYSKIKARVKIDNILYDWIKDLCGTNQGCPVSPDIFNICC